MTAPYIVITYKLYYILYTHLCDVSYKYRYNIVAYKILHILLKMVLIEQLLSKNNGQYCVKVYF